MNKNPYNCGFRTSFCDNVTIYFSKNISFAKSTEYESDLLCQSTDPIHILYWICHPILHQEKGGRQFKIVLGNHLPHHVDIGHYKNDHYTSRYSYSTNHCHHTFDADCIDHRSIYTSALSYRSNTSGMAQLETFFHADDAISFIDGVSYYSTQTRIQIGGLL